MKRRGQRCKSFVSRKRRWSVTVSIVPRPTRPPSNPIWFASCNICHEQHRNCCSLVIAPDGRVHAQTEMKKEQLLVADIDIDQATQAMFKFNMKDCAKMLFAESVSKQECASTGAMRG